MLNQTFEGIQPTVKNAPPLIGPGVLNYEEIFLSYDPTVVKTPY